MRTYFRQLWEDAKYDAWRWSRIVPRLRFCKGRHCLRLFVAYPLLFPTLCHRHRREQLLAGFERVREHFEGREQR